MLPEATDLARKTAERANIDLVLKVREKGGKNKGKRIKEYLATVGLKEDGHPYCIAAVCTWIKEACAEMACSHAVLFSPSCMRFLDYAKKTGHAFDPSELDDAAIPCVGIIDHGKGLGHAALIVGSSDNGFELQTIEANTNPGGSREGDGVYSRTRKRGEFAGMVRIA